MRTSPFISTLCSWICARGAANSYASAAFLRGALPLGQGVVGGALRSAVALQVSRRILAPLMAAAAALWLPPAAKEGQGDCEFPLLPP